MSLAAIDMLLPEYASPTLPKRQEVSISEKADEEDLARQMLVAQWWARVQKLSADVKSAIPTAEAESTKPTIEDSANTAKIESALGSALAELKRYEGYGRRWDGYFAEPFEDVVLRRSRQILVMAHQMFVKEQIVPSLLTTGPASDGSVDVEIRETTRTLFFTIYPETEIEITAIDEGTEPIRRIVPFENMRLARWLYWLAGKGNIPQALEDYRSHSG